MLYSLFLNLIDTYSFLNVFKYLTVRTGLAMFTSMLVVFLVGTPFINFFSARQIHDPIRSDGPEDHIIKKIGTPTMGGLLILLGLFSGILLWGDLSSPYIWFLMFIVGSFGFIGAYDDYKKIKQKNSSGISLKIKLFLQIFLAFLGIYILVYFVDTPELKNVQCEVCHGAGKKHASAPRPGFGNQAKKACNKCHVKNHSPKFNYTQYWPKIKH